MKNKMMRIASVLMVAVILSVCAVSGSFAKYVTTESGTDTARVAKWGVTIEAEAGLFADKYDTTDTATYTGPYSVQAGAAASADAGEANPNEGSATVEGSTTEKVVAPGTSGSLAKIGLKGTPEVAVKVSYTAEASLTGWNITVDQESKFYCPIEVTVGDVVIKGLEQESAEAFATAINNAIAGASAVYGPNTDLSAQEASLSVAWAWAFQGAEGGAQTDEYDTMLGNLAAEGNAPTIQLDFTVSVTQID